MVSKRAKWEDVCIEDLPNGSEGELCRQLGCEDGNYAKKTKMNRSQRPKVSGAKDKDTRSDPGRFGSNNNQSFL